MARPPDKRKPHIHAQSLGETAHHMKGSSELHISLGQDFAHRSPGTRTRKNGKYAAAPWSTRSQGLWNDIKSFRWIVVPSSSLKILLIVGLLWASWEVVAPYVSRDLPNPFAPLFFISHHIPTSSPGDPRYRKGYLDLVFIAYHIVFWSFVRQMILVYLLTPVARHFRVKKAKLVRFGEQGYAMLYFAAMAVWGVRIMSQLPTWWYDTKYFWIDYPHWEMKPELKRYYLMQASYWCHQLIILLLKLEKPRKDYNELVAHHFVTLWLVGWSYLINLTLIGQAVYLSMDLPDTFLALSMLLNYLRWDRVKITVFAVFISIWSYFRHWLNWVILYSVLFEFDLMPESSKRWAPEDGVWMVWWMKYQVFVPLLALQGLNLFWYFLIWRLAYRAVKDITVTDDRSDVEDDGEDDAEGKDD
ncbi:longevity assurance proteins LAG1/LAC1 [Lentinus brumalis]|uniref:Longevity assurance proteins LAG1/LAC1 n=1 Tax=Lentinus brumalis TaxID=2498619 RepID=A0A371DJ34_9APHY|nr:longevity assurance proteins LAG1/LAC1 [Polyporus brumalis]